MPTSQPRAVRNPIPVGEHILTLKSCTEEEQPGYNDPTTMVIRWHWIFESRQKDPETGNAYELHHYTGFQYGGHRAALTMLFDQMLPDRSEDDKAHFPTDDLIGLTYRARIRHEKADNPNDPPKPKLVYIEPCDPKAKVIKPPPDRIPDLSDSDDNPLAGEKDPFADQ